MLARDKHSSFLQRLRTNKKQLGPFSPMLDWREKIPGTNTLAYFFPSERVFCNTEVLREI
jgi:hypothetical protein